jgi:hypothetical protein
MKRLSKVTVTLISVVLAGLACFEGFVIYWCIHSPDSQTRELFAFSGIAVFLALMLVMAGMWLHYLEIRYFQIPIWRWMIGGCKGKPDTPLGLGRFAITREQTAEAKKKMSRYQHAWMWVGNVCGGLGVSLLLIAVIWRLVLAITFKETIGSTANILFLVGFLVTMLGFGVVRLCLRGKIAKN